VEVTNTLTERCHVFSCGARIPSKDKGELSVRRILLNALSASEVAHRGVSACRYPGV
jgi:hypothetical protein